jgi:hypothetical protein
LIAGVSRFIEPVIVPSTLNVNVSKALDEPQSTTMTETSAGPSEPAEAGIGTDNVSEFNTSSYRIHLLKMLTNSEWVLEGDSITTLMSIFEPKVAVGLADAVKVQPVISGRLGLRPRIDTIFKTLSVNIGCRRKLELYHPAAKKEDLKALIT